jgi:16S rRNA (guanine527-N7)-methyltransferase
MNVDIILKYFPDLTELQIEQFSKLGALYPEWNSKINVISRKDIDNLFINHILHSLSIAKLIYPVAGTSIMDLGTGGGFPGVPLAIMWPNCQFHLIDRIRKKILVASEISKAIGLSNVTFQHGDSGECHEKFDYVVSRAVMPLNELISASNKNISHNAIGNQYKNGLICLKGGDIIKESEGVNYPVITYPINEFFDEPFFETKEIVYVPMSDK